MEMSNKYDTNRQEALDGNENDTRRQEPLDGSRGAGEMESGLFPSNRAEIVRI